ncbi:tripartite tricarboxylate transporter substrate binding protein [Variovorax defluvii]|uniref:Tripartite tricarboxylate transporter substrate binding protein n=1 Tax=Variovorax defluvii TaxID=913761 RepID=A0ABP8HKQ3_9BURK
MTLISPFGSSVDMFGRLVAEQLSKRLGATFVVEQKLGAGGTIATAYLNRQKPDGYTLGIGVPSTLSIAPHIYKNVGYRPQDLTYLAALMSAPSVLIVAPDRTKSLRDLVELSKRRSLNFGSPGVGSGMHLGVERFTTSAGIANAIHVPFKSTEALTMALVAGDIDYYMSVTSASAALIKSGRLAALAVTGDARSADLPGVPTFAEIGLTDMDLPNFYGLVGPPGLPKEITARLESTLQTIAEAPDFLAGVTRTGNVPISLIGNAFKEFAVSDLARQGALIKKLGIEPQ